MLKTRPKGLQPWARFPSACPASWASKTRDFLGAIPDDASLGGQTSSEKAMEVAATGIRPSGSPVVDSEILESSMICGGVGIGDGAERASPSPARPAASPAASPDSAHSNPLPHHPAKPSAPAPDPLPSGCAAPASFKGFTAAASFLEYSTSIGTAFCSASVGSTVGSSPLG